MGPFTFADNNPILATNADETIHGPGHHSILKEGDDYYIVTTVTIFHSLQEECTDRSLPTDWYSMMKAAF